jgi:hypothetical protein
VNPSQASGPSYTGLLVHRDAEFGFWLLIPDGWHQLNVESGAGVFFAPDPTDLLTGVAVEGRDLGTPVDASDLPALRRGFLRGLRSLHGARIDTHEAAAVGPLITLEARHTFRDREHVRKRWVRLLYQDQTLVRVIAQAASVEAFDYWEPMFFTAMRSVQFGSFGTIAEHSA